MELGLKGRTAVITGGSMGIGKAAAKGLALEGVNVVLLARGQEALDSAADEIRSESGVEVLTISTDVTATEAVNAAAAAVQDRFEAVNILVCSHGHRMRRMDRQILWEDEDWQGDLEAKMMGFLRVIRAFLGPFAKDGTGRIINVSGVAGTMVFHNALTHGFNNAAMIHVSRYLARDLAGDNINVNVVAPGLAATEWRHGWASTMAENKGVTKEEFLDAYCEQMGIIAGRWGYLDEIADLIVFLASDRAKYINGEVVMIDGGMNINPR
ncbi:MAG: SDR family oxidoreductase [Anaerolineales bacterium]|nr:SDR family oxidoreductase [Anaerolineales bacterium]